jgi:hypothetical protein
MKNKLAMLAAALVVAASVSVAKAQPYAIAGDFNGWNNTGPLGGGPTIYTNIMTGGTPGTFEGCKIIAVPGSWATAYPGGNLEMSYDAGGSNTVYFYPGTFGDGWLPAQNRVGFEDPGNMTFEITGDFTSPNWGDDPNGLMTLEAGSRGVYTNIWVFPVAGSYNFKIRSPGTWGHFNCGTDFGGGGNIVITTTAANQAITITLDLPNGRVMTSVPPVYCNVQFSVDMTFEAAGNPGFDPTSVTVNGDALPAGWGGTSCTNNPSAANPNIYTSSNLTIQVGTSVQYQFRCIVDGITQYDALGGVGGVNRTVKVPNMGSTNIPPVYWNDALPIDVLDADTLVTFSVSMTNSQQYPSGPAFIPGSGQVYMNGDFIGWITPWNPINLASYQLTRNGTSEVYTYSQTFLKGQGRSVTYKYAINGTDNEAAPYQNHFRYIRSTGGAAYNMPLDTFGNQYVEPKVGGLVIGQPSGGSVLVTWLPYSNVQLQSNSSLNNPAGWQNVAGTMGASSKSITVGGAPQYFRLIQP